MTADKPTRPNLSQILLGNNASIQGLARADWKGSVLEVAGKLDGETVCAVVAMAAQNVSAAAGQAGLEAPKAWHVSLNSSTFYIVHRQDEFLVMAGNTVRNPTSVLRMLTKSCGA